jgi:hypothetical protein
MANNILSKIDEAVRSASAISLRAELAPASSLPGDERLFVLPPTYANVGHLVSPERPDGRRSACRARRQGQAEGRS